ncbi:MAG: dynamin family protein, partial [Prevotella sp.]
MAFSKEKQQKLVSSLTNIGALAGTNEIGVAGGIEGLGLSTAQALCDNEAKTVRDGLFKVAIMGTFSSGKSTVINALIGAKILPESSLPCTAILTYIQYGRPEDENRVDVYMADGLQKDGSIKTGDCIQMSVEDFQEEYKYTFDDELEFRNTGKVERFARVKHAVMYCSQPLMEGGICIIDSPGLEDKAIATELAMKVAKESQAIVY